MDSITPWVPTGGSTPVAYKSPILPTPAARFLPPDQEKRHRLRQLGLQRYSRLRERNVTLIIDEYEPRGRYIEYPDLPERPDDLPRKCAWWRGRGIPHEVSRPYVDDLEHNRFVLDPYEPWIPFKRFMMDIARMWTRPQQQAEGLNEELFGNVYGCTRINFFRVMRYRISLHKAYAFWTDFMRDLQVTALTDRFPQLDSLRNIQDENSTLDLAETARFNHRQSLIMLSLIGLNNLIPEYDPVYNNAGVEQLKDFIRSPAVRGPWIEFVRDYLDSHPMTENPQWCQLQPAMANKDVATLRRNFYTQVNVDKTNWTLLDHTVRFITFIYEHGLSMSVDREETMHIWNYDWPFGHYFYDDISATDMTDRYWFGFSLLMLLIRSWQYNRAHPNPDYGRILVPALYHPYEPNEYEFPENDVGMVDLSPKSKWEIGQPIRTNFDFVNAFDSGFIAHWWQRHYHEDESDTPIDNDGYRVPHIRRETRSFAEAFDEDVGFFTLF
ncbi:uncharacterized protein F4812DRAFT_469755 [Daldinia caldariorum]|uniref:uncharacterized protein n=1 Tax=Daldinia caldariorum TaxID=326644 RepID=UPI0020083A5A|nr:uncharacterized protein F4812DRAFT_469755 [Daldinia caldariorum]KAI1469665.1 hypothetical protein F4812DRAFT_469755 [Daldinia caldariorum]